jgi:hypothetical protein
VTEVASNHHGVITLVRLESELLMRLDVLCLHSLDLGGKDGLGGGGRVDTRGLDGDDNVSSVLEEVVRVEGNDSGLVRLGDVGKDDVDHREEHAVLVGVSGILDDGDDVRSLLGHVDQVSAGSVRELDGVDGSLRSDNVGNVRDRGSRGGSEVEDLLSRRDVDLVETSKDTSGKLGSEGVPHSVLGLDLGSVLSGGSDGDSLLSVDGVSGDEVSGDEEVLLALGDEDTLVPVRLEDDRRSSLLGSDTRTTSSSASATSSSVTASSTVTPSSSTSTTPVTSSSASSVTEPTSASASSSSVSSSESCSDSSDGRAKARERRAG